MRKTFLSTATLLAISLSVFSCKCERKNAATATDTSTTNVEAGTNSIAGIVVGKLDTLSGNFIYDTGILTDLTLPNGTKISQVGANSTEAKLFNFLNDKNAMVSEDKTKGWITLDRIYFDTGKAILKSESQQQIKNIVEILKAFPTATVKVGGYTDNTGSADANTKVSAERATTVASLISTSGISTNNIASEGYGPLHPICEANDTPECQAQNRRVDIRVIKK